MSLTQIVSISVSLAIDAFLFVGLVNYVQASGNFDLFIKKTASPDFEKLKQIYYRYDKAAACVVVAMLIWLLFK